MTNMLNIALPWIFSLMGGVIFYVCARHYIGWLIGVAQMIVLVPLSMLAHESGFYAQSIIYSSVFIWNYFAERREHRKPEELKPKCTRCSKVIKKVAAA